LPIFPPKYDFAVNQILTKRETQSRVTIFTKSRVTFSQKKKFGCKKLEARDEKYATAAYLERKYIFHTGGGGKLNLK